MSRKLGIPFDGISTDGWKVRVVAFKLGIQVGPKRTQSRRLGGIEFENSVRPPSAAPKAMAGPEASNR